MNIFGIGTGELLLIMIIAAMVVGPEQMVRLSRSAGRLLGRLRRETAGIQQEFREAISTFDEVTEVAAEARAALNDVQSEVQKAGQDVQAAASDIKQVANETKAAAISAGTVGATPATPSTPATPGTTAFAARPSTSTAAPARSASTAPAGRTAPTPNASKPAQPVRPPIDGEVAIATPTVVHALSPDEATEVALAEIVPEDPTEAEPIEIAPPTLMIDLNALAAAAKTANKPTGAPASQG
ncbi:MAG: hypothetical protein GX557_11470 [Chloroflexi bacterium]|nr:hypothetical protein [Chloroflexota bacterium]